MILDRLRDIAALVVLLAMGSLCPFDSAVELRAARGKCEEANAAGFRKVADAMIDQGVV